MQVGTEKQRLFVFREVQRPAWVWEDVGYDGSWFVMSCAFVVAWSWA